VVEARRRGLQLRRRVRRHQGHPDRRWHRLARRERRRRGRPRAVKGVDPQASHVANFLECVGTRARPHTDIEQGHLSARLCHLGNIAHRVGRVIAFDGATETIPGDAEAAALLRREYSDRYELPSQV
jgi:hypothetical protein